jgi:TRAP-type C4-dicarboxylate transport system permease small subunit
VHLGSTWRRETVSATWLETPLWLPQAAMPIGMALLIATLLVGLLRRLGGRGE